MRNAIRLVFENNRLTGRSCGAISGSQAMSDPTSTARLYRVGEDGAVVGDE